MPARQRDGVAEEPEADGPRGPERGWGGRMGVSLGGMGIGGFLYRVQSINRRADLVFEHENL